jgi:acetolactate decarboxylase
MQSKSLKSPAAPVTHTLFQVSTSGALVAGLFSGVVSCQTLLQHGDFGLGTFADLDGEMVVIDGHVYLVRGDGTVSEAPADAEAPFGVVTRFDPDVDHDVTDIESLAVLAENCDKARRSSNIFYAFRLDGIFDMVRTRAVNPSLNQGRLIDATKVQAEFAFSHIAGSLIGFWSPGFSSAFSISGYHFHFISDDRQHGGHLLGCSSKALQLRAEALTDFHLALPENEAFLKADLKCSPQTEYSSLSSRLYL